MSPEEKEIKKIIKETIKKMEALGVYRPQFDETIKIYSEQIQEKNALNKQFIEGKIERTQQYTNKAGFTNTVETLEYKRLNQIRKDIIDNANILGLTPSGLKKIKNENAPKKRVSKLGQAMSSLGK